MPNPNVMFKRGEHKNLPPVNGAQDGVFYLTTDTNRLYVGNGSNLVELNKSITTIGSATELYALRNVEVGQFYYITGTSTHTDTANSQTSGGNILAVCTAVNASGVPTWVQVNPDTDTKDNDNTKVVGTSAQEMVEDSVTDTANTRFIYDGISDGKAHYRLVVAQKTSHFSGNDTDESNVIAKLDLDLSELVAGSTNVGVSAAASTQAGVVSVSATGAGADSTQSFTIAQGSNVQITGSKDAIEISATDTRYTLESPANSTNINFAIDGGANQASIAITGGTNIGVSGTTKDSLVINHSASGVTADTYGTNSSLNPAAGGSFVIPQITVDAQGHVTSAADATITLPSAVDDAVTAVSAGSDGKIVISQTGKNDVKSGEDLFFNINQVAADGTSTTQKVLNQGNLGTYYTKAAIDSKLQGLNAMTYKGTAFGTGATVAALPTTGVKIGDAYLASADNGSYKKGDLLIATGTETDGVITSGLDWTVVPSGSDTDTQYEAGVNGTNLTFNVAGQTETTFATIAGGEELTASGSGTTITIDHDESGVTAGSKGLAEDATPSAAGSFTVPYITVNRFGHVTALAEHTVTLPSAQAAYALEKTGAKISLTQGGADKGNVTFVNGTRIAVDGTTAGEIKFNHEAAPAVHLIQLQVLLPIRLLLLVVVLLSLRFTMTTSDILLALSLELLHCPPIIILLIH